MRTVHQGQETVVTETRRLDLKLNIQTQFSDRGVSGWDTTMLAVPEQFLIQLDDDGPPALAAKQFATFLRRLAESQAADLGERLHHAEFTITRDRETVKRLGLMHDCVDCLAGVERALEFLDANPDKDMVVGQLWWAV